MDKQKYVAFGHTVPYFGFATTRLTDIRISDGTVTFAAEHGGELTLTLTDCVQRLSVAATPDTIILAYAAENMLGYPSPTQQVWGHPAPYAQGLGGQSGIVRNDPAATVESMVGALFQHELTTRLIEPMRQAARLTTTHEKSSDWAPSTGLYLQNHDGGLVYITSIQFDDGKFIFGTSDGGTTEVIAQYLVTISRPNFMTSSGSHTLLGVSQDIDWDYSVRSRDVHAALASSFPNAAREYAEHMANIGLI